MKIYVDLPDYDRLVKYHCEILPKMEQEISINSVLYYVVDISFTDVDSNELYPVLHLGKIPS